MEPSGDFSSKSEWKYLVFLSFRGEDTRLGFTDHLYSALQRKSISTFRDDEEIARGEVISPALLQAIEQSLSAIVIISQNYANSSWCLDELLKILETKQKLGLVFPVFYGVDPSDVRHQRGSFAEAFRKHEEKFTDDKEKVQKWRDALTEVASLSGWDSKGWHETKLIEEIVAQVWSKLEPKLPTFTDELIGIDRRLEDMYSLLLLKLEEVRFIGIWGMGGIGKTTLASIVFRKIKSQFDVSCFLANVRQVSGDHHGLVHLQNEIVSQVRMGGMEIKALDEGKDYIRYLLHNRKVLLVLDDVSARSQLENLVGNQDWFGSGSRVIVTTRDKHLLISHQAQFQIYGAEILNSDESLELFCKNAFKGDQPEEDYLMQSKNVVDYAGGLPLALEVLGSFLCKRSVREWEDALDKIKQLQRDDIMGILRLSYDMLEDEQKTIFLDIACFFKGWHEDTVTKILKNCGLHPTIDINVLVEKSLVTCNRSVLGMHDLLEEMGKTIVLQESPDDPGRRSRLWSLEDIDYVLSKNKGTEKVRGIVLNPSADGGGRVITFETSCPYEVYWDPEAFSKMCNLRLLIILRDLNLPLGLNCLSSSLKVLQWKECPLTALPLGMPLDELVHLEMNGSRIEQLWNRTQYMRKLKVINLSSSTHLIETPNISGVPNLEELILYGCVSLVEVHQSVAQHKKLEILDLMNCSNLKILPAKLEMSSLRTFTLSGCSEVAKLPEFGENMKSLSELDLSNCKNLLCLPNTISNLKSLIGLNISDCSKVSRLPENINENKALEYLILCRTGIREVNSALCHLENLRRLSLSGCKGPAACSSSLTFESQAVGMSLMLPSSISGLSSLQVLDLSYCNLTDESIPDDLGCLSSLEELVLCGNNFVDLPAHYFADLSKLRHLDLDDCPRLQSLPKLPPHMRVYADCPPSQLEAYLLDPETLWNLFAHSRGEKVKDWFYPLHNTWSTLSAFGSSVSMEVEIPDHCLSNGWWGVWGIVACMAFASEPVDVSFETQPPMIRVTWGVKNVFPGHILFQFLPTNGNSYMFIFFMMGNHVYFHLHARGDPNKGKLYKIQKRHFSENSKLQVDVGSQSCKIETKNSGWRVLCEDAMKELHKLMSVKLIARKTSKDSFQVEDASIVVNAQQENSNELEVKEDGTTSAINDNRGIFSRKLTQGLCLTVMTLVTVMVGYQVFLSPKQGFKLGTNSSNATEKIWESPKVSRFHPPTSASVVRKSKLQQRNHKTTASQMLGFSGHQIPARRCSQSCHFSSFTR